MIVKELLRTDWAHSIPLLPPQKQHGYRDTIGRHNEVFLHSRSMVLQELINTSHVSNSEYLMFSIAGGFLLLHLQFPTSLLTGER